MKLNPAFAGLKPERVLEIFSDVLKIPRRSHEEDLMVSYIRVWAEGRGYEYKVDDAKNIVVFVPANNGLDKAPTLCLQAHTDMVCEGKTEWPIEIDVKDGWVMTKGQTQTLGADNGIGCSMMMAICDEMHGPLELLFSSDEEDDFSGCEKFRREFFGLNSKYLINLDTPHDGRITVASAGFQYLKPTLKLERTDSNVGKYFKLTLDNMPGGHSGEDVHSFRGNALKFMGKLLSRLPLGSSLVSIDGGEQTNSIPKACTAVVLVSDSDWSRDDFRVLGTLVENESETLRCRIRFDVQPCVCTDMPLTAACHETIVSLLRTIPSGVVIMSTKLEDLPELSSTLSLVKPVEGEDALRFTHMIRGATEALIEGLCDELKAAYSSQGCEMVVANHGRSWIQDPSHPLVKAAQAAYERTGYAAALSGNHGAIEPGTLCGDDPSNPQFEAAVSFGCWIRDEHKETERFALFSLERTFAALRYLVSNSGSFGL